MVNFGLFSINICILSPPDFNQLLVYKDINVICSGFYLINKKNILHDGMPDKLLNFGDIFYKEIKKGKMN